MKTNISLCCRCWLLAHYNLCAAIYQCSYLGILMDAIVGSSFVALAPNQSHRAWIDRFILEFELRLPVAHFKGYFRNRVIRSNADELKSKMINDTITSATLSPFGQSITGSLPDSSTKNFPLSRLLWLRASTHSTPLKWLILSNLSVQSSDVVKTFCPTTCNFSGFKFYLKFEDCPLSTNADGQCY